MPFSVIWHTLLEEAEDLPPGATLITPLSHKRFRITDTQEHRVVIEIEGPTTTQVVSQGEPEEPEERIEPDISVYSDVLLLIDALERQDLDPLEDVETNALVNLYTLLSDVQRGANDLRQDVADVLLDRLHHDCPVHGQYGSVQRTTRRNR